MYRLEFRKKALKEIKKLHPSDQKRMVRALERLEKNPFSRALDTRRLARAKNTWRLRVGAVRAIYELDTKEKKIYVWEVGYRGGIY